MRTMLVMLVALMSLSLGALAQDASNTAAPTPTPAPTTGGSNGGNGTWAQNHPVRAADNKELRQDVKDGTLTKRQAAKDRRMERRMAAKNGGHLTAHQQKRLQDRINRQQARDAAHK